MNRKQKRIFDEIYAEPVSAKLQWKDVESLLNHLGATITEGNGSRIRIHLNGQRHTFHKPHPHKEMKKYSVLDLQDYLRRAGVIYDKEL